MGLGERRTDVHRAGGGLGDEPLGWARRPASATLGREKPRRWPSQFPREAAEARGGGARARRASGSRARGVRCGGQAESRAAPGVGERPGGAGGAGRRGLLCARGVPGARWGARLWPAGGGGARAGGRGRGGGLAGDPVPAVLRAQLAELRRPGRGGRDFCALSLLPIMQTKRAHYGPLDDAGRVRKVKVTAVRKCVLLEAS